VGSHLLPLLFPNHAIGISGCVYPTTRSPLEK
jgi:hypothetical protein